jgi:hypothetical protein
VPWLRYPPVPDGSKDDRSQRQWAVGLAGLDGRNSARYRCHQQHLRKNPYGYCPDHGTGISCPVGVVRADG